MIESRRVSDEFDRSTCELTRLKVLVRIQDLLDAHDGQVEKGQYELASLSLLDLEYFINDAYDDVNAHQTGLDLIVDCILLVVLFCRLLT